MDTAYMILKVGAVVAGVVLIGVPAVGAIAACMLSSHISREEEQIIAELDANERGRMSLEG
jgi:hypothetical protein